MIATLGTQMFFLGAALVLSKGNSISGIPESFYFLGQAKVFGMPLQMLLLFGLAIFLIIIPLPLFIFGIIGIVSATKRVEVYKGKVIYHIGFKNKEYRMSDIQTSKTKSETYRTGLDYGNIVPIYSYDKLTVFYDKKGKKIFKFGLAYDNVERLKADVNNTQKSIAKQHNKN